MSVKVRVTDKSVGEFFVQPLNKPMKRGSVIDLSEEHFNASYTQNAIRLGFLEIITSGIKATTPKGKFYINIYKNAISIKCLNISVKSDSEFFIPKDMMGKSEIISLINSGYISPVDGDMYQDGEEESGEVASAVESLEREASDIKEKESKNQSVKKKSTKKKSSKKKSSKKVSKKSSNSKKIKKIFDDSIEDIDGPSSTDADKKISVSDDDVIDLDFDLEDMDKNTSKEFINNSEIE